MRHIPPLRCFLIGLFLLLASSCHKTQYYRCLVPPTGFAYVRLCPHGLAISRYEAGGADVHGAPFVELGRGTWVSENGKIAVSWTSRKEPRFPTGRSPVMTSDQMVLEPILQTTPASGPEVTCEFTQDVDKHWEENLACEAH